MAKSDDILILAGLGAGAFVLFTEQGKSMFEDLTGIGVPDIGFSLDDILSSGGGGGGRNYEDEGGVEELVEREREKSGNYSNSNKRRRGVKFPAGYHPNYSSTDYYYPVQDLFIPPNYFDFKYQSDPYRVPSEKFADWYAKGSGLIPEDYYFPDHHYWNPDYYYYFGNLYKMWYPNVYDISHVPLRRMPYWFGEVYY